MNYTKLLNISLLFTLFSGPALADLSQKSHRLQSAQYETVYFNETYNNFVRNPPLAPNSVDPLAQLASNISIKWRNNKKSKNLLKSLKNAKQKLKDIRTETRTTYWEVQIGEVCAKYINGNLDGENTCSLKYHSLFLVGDEAIANWQKNEEILDIKITQANENRSFSGKDEINNCINAHIDTKPVTTNKTFRYACDNSTQSANPISASYVHSINNQVMNISKSINYTTTHILNKADIPALKIKVLRAMQCSREFFARHMIKINLSISFDMETKHLLPNTAQIHLHERLSRLSHSEKKETPEENSINAYDLPVVGYSNDPDHRFYYLSDEILCALYTHEFAHNIGLSDQYREDDACPDRIVLSDRHDDLMKNSWKNPDQLSLTKYQLRQLTAPICYSEVSPSETRAETDDRAFYW